MSLSDCEMFSGAKKVSEDCNHRLSCLLYLDYAELGDCSYII